MPDALPLSVMHGAVEHALDGERSRGQPLKAAFHAVARRLGLSPRRVRAYHYREVAADDVRASELLTVDAEFRRDLAALAVRLETIRGLIGADASGDAVGALAPGRVSSARPVRGGQCGGVGQDPALGVQPSVGEG